MYNKSVSAHPLTSSYQAGSHTLAFSHQAMRHALSSDISAPSASLLRFLKAQSEEVCFFTSNGRFNTRQRPYRNLSSKFLTLLPPFRRNLNTTPQAQATVHSSLHGFENLKPSSGKDVSTSLPAHSSPNRLWPCVSNDDRSNPATSRGVSTDSRPLLQRILGRRNHDPDAKPKGLPPLPSFLDDVGGAALGRSKAAKGTNELKLRCTEFNEDGKVTLVNGEFKKTELIAKVYCLPRVTDLV